MILAALSGAAFFAAAGSLGAMAGFWFVERIDGLPDGPPQVAAPIVLLVCSCAAIGALAVSRHVGPAQIVLIALVCGALVAIWITDARRGIVPDALTLGPLAILLLVALFQHRWPIVFSAAIPFVPFAAAAALSRGRGMGWGDVKLVALGGAVLGAQVAVLAFAFACIAAVLVNSARGRRRGPIAFAPYLAAAIGLSIPAAILR